MKWWNDIRDSVLKLGKKQLAKFIFKKLGWAVGGFKGWLLGLLINKLWDKLIKPNAYWAARKIKTAVKKPFYKKKAKDLDDAQTEMDFDSSADNMP